MSRIKQKPIHRLPFKAVIFDLDGVLTKTELLHNRAWKEVFDTYLEERQKLYDEPWIPFSPEEDYLSYVDGRPRFEGVRCFLGSRNIQLPWGYPEDDPEQETICGIGNRKNSVFKRILETEGVEVYPSSIELIRKLRSEGIRVGVASSSRNCRKILDIAGLHPLIESIVDGEVSSALGLKGKPEPDIFLQAASNLGTTPDETIIVEDALSGVAAGRKGNFGLVIGIARKDNPRDLYVHGADIVVKDLDETGFDGMVSWFREGLDKDCWSLTYHDYDPAQERCRETLLSIGNGYIGNRGALEEVEPGKINYPGTYIAGVYNKLSSQVSGKELWNEDLVNVTNWIQVGFSISRGKWFDINNTTLLEMKRWLNFKDGMLSKEMTVRDAEGNETLICSRRIVSMHNSNLSAIKYTLKPLNYSGFVTLKSILSADHINDGVERYRRLNQKHLLPVHEWVYGNMQQVEVETSGSGIRILETSKVNVTVNGKNADTVMSGACRRGVAELLMRVHVTKGSRLTLEKVVHIEHLRRDEKGSNDYADILNRAGSFSDIAMASAKAWKKIWSRLDIKAEGDRLGQKLLRMHLYHLMCTTSPNTTGADVGIPARGLTGEAYRGHIFWDELFILPLYFLHYPEIARSVLMYRYRRLDAARQLALEHGYEGAMYPWQSGSTGEEETQQYHYNPVSGTWGEDQSSLQRHISLAIARNILQYHHIVQDHDFMVRFGAEILIEICRFWCSLAKPDPETGQYSISNVMGPDEFHEYDPNTPGKGLKDNTYTNVMTAWLFREVINLLHTFKPNLYHQLAERLKLRQVETSVWKHIAENLFLAISSDGILAQFDGYFGLQEVDWERYRKRYANIGRLDRILKAENMLPDQYKVSKQADTLMLFYNLEAENVTQLISGMGYRLPPDYPERNMAYYLPRTTHGSTLSRVVHASLAVDAGEYDLGWRLYREALVSDYHDIQGGTTAEGIHTGVMAGTVMLAMTAFGGVNFHGDMPRINPKLPREWKKLTFAFTFKRVHYHLSVTHDQAEITADSESAVLFKGKEIKLTSGVRYILD